MITNRNICGECRACCIVLPIAEPDFVKAAGEPCKHLCASGCSLFKSKELPELCRDYYCEWRIDKWFEQRPEYRPDIIGVIFQYGRGTLSIFETRPNALNTARVQYVKARLRKNLLVKLYPYGVQDGIKYDPATVINGTVDTDISNDWIESEVAR